MVPGNWMKLMNVRESRSETHRLLIVSDIPAVMGLSSLAGWNQTAEDWRMLIDLDPEGCFAVEVEGNLAATTTLQCYGNRLAWIGMVLTKPEYRRLGLARKLLARALERVCELKISTVKLDATEQGQPLYESLGFRAEQVVERWSRSGFPAVQPKTTDCGWSECWQKFDIEAFGADRSRLLRRLAERNPPLATDQAYLFSRTGRVSSYIGPCVAKDRASARKVIEQCVRTTKALGWFWDLIPENHDAVAIARELGFVPQRRLLRMVRGNDLRDKEELTYAIAGFEFG